MNNQLKELSEVKSSFMSRESVYKMEIKRLTEEIDELKELLMDVENEKNAAEESGRKESKQLSDELLQVKSKLRESEGNFKELRKEFDSFKETAAEGDGILKNTQDGMSEVCAQLLDVQRKVGLINGGGEKVISKKDVDGGDATVSPLQCFKMITHIKGQVQTLNVAVEKAANKLRNVAKEREEGEGESGEVVNDIIGENAHLKEQILKLKTLVHTKREQISTLRTVLKANKSTYEVALANLKSRYENDKQIQADANGQLKKQLKSLKSECQTFASLRSMFATRCEEYLKELQEKQKAILAAEEEKRTLNQLLKQAIHQKVALTQRVEEFEIARERLRQFTKKNGGKSSSGTSGSGGASRGPRGPPKPVTRL